MILTFNVEYILLLPALIILGLIASYTDIKDGKIKNQHLIISLTYGFIVYIGLFIYYFLTGNFYLNNLIQIISNFIISIFAGYFLWHFKVWSAGDGKLFIVLSTLFPLGLYSKNYVPYFPGLVLLLNIFIAGLIYVVLLVFIREKLLKLLSIFWKSLLKSSSIDKLGKMLLKLFIILVLTNFIFISLGLSNNKSFFLKLIFIFFIYKPLGKIDIKYILLLSISFLGLWLFDIINLGKTFWIELLISFIFVKLVRALLFGYLNDISLEYFSKEVSVQELNEGMILADIFITKKSISNVEFKKLEKEGIEILKPKNTYYLRKPKSTLFDKSLIDSESEGLTKKDIKKIKSLNGTKVRIYKSMPFAFIIFLGLILSIFFRGFLI